MIVTCLIKFVIKRDTSSAVRFPIINNEITFYLHGNSVTTMTHSAKYNRHNRIHTHCRFQLQRSSHTGSAMTLSLQPTDTQALPRTIRYVTFLQPFYAPCHYVQSSYARKRTA